MRSSFREKSKRQFCEKNFYEKSLLEDVCEKTCQGDSSQKEPNRTNRTITVCPSLSSKTYRVKKKAEEFVDGEIYL